MVGLAHVPAPGLHQLRGLLLPEVEGALRDALEDALAERPREGRGLQPGQLLPELRALDRSLWHLLAV